MELNMIRTGRIVVPSRCLLLIPSLQNKFGKKKIKNILIVGSSNIENYNRSESFL